ncbi:MULTISPECIES: hypothetical protein [unclassified Chryseobacterium]|uniref:hypothetical protein n=1 Tax=unclassified Chryseobacterium TaxID=2593645 RepID=UPI0030104667
MKKYILILITFILVSCNFNKIYQNREEDKKEEAFKLFGDGFFQVTSKKQLEQMLDRIDKDCGDNIKKN